MSEQMNNDSSQYSDTPERQSNIKLVYDYTKNLIEDENESLNRIDAKLTGFLAFTGLLVKFEADLPGGEALKEGNELICYTCIILKVLGLICLAIAFILLGLGLTSSFNAGIIRPKVLMEKWLYEDKDRYRAFIINTWIDSEQKYKQLGFEKAKKLNISVQLISAAFVSFTANTILVAFLKM